MRCSSQEDSSIGPSACPLRKSTVSKSTMAPTMALSGAAGASMRRPPGARSAMMASSGMAAISLALSQRASRLSRSANKGARSSDWPSTSMPKLSSHEPSRLGCVRAVMLAVRGPSGATSSRPVSWPVAGSITKRQRSTATLWCANPGRTTTAQPWACSLGICSAQKSPKWPSSGSDHRFSWPSCAAGLRHCRAVAGKGRKPKDHSKSRASASALPLRCISTRWSHAPRSNSVALGRVLSKLCGAGVSQCSPPCSSAST